MNESWIHPWSQNYPCENLSPCELEARIGFRRPKKYLRLRPLGALGLKVVHGRGYVHVTSCDHVLGTHRRWKFEAFEIHQTFGIHPNSTVLWHLTMVLGVGHIWRNKICGKSTGWTGWMQERPHVTHVRHYVVNCCELYIIHSPTRQLLSLDTRWVGESSPNFQLAFWEGGDLPANEVVGTHGLG